MSRARRRILSPSTQLSASPIDPRRLMSSSLRSDMREEENDLDRQDVLAERQALRDERLQLRQQKDAESAREKTEKERERLSNEAREAEYRSQGISYERDSSNRVVPQRDPLTGRPAVRDLKGDTQYDQTGKAFQIQRVDGKVKQEYLDQKAPVGPTENGGNFVYRQNKTKEWDAIDPEEGLLSPDKDVKNASVSFLMDKERKEIAKRKAELGLELKDPSKPAPNAKALEAAKARSLSGLATPEDAEVLKVHEQRKAKEAEAYELDKKAFEFQSLTPEEYASRRAAALSPDKVKMSRERMLAERTSGLKSLSDGLSKEMAAHEEEYKAFLPRTRSFRAEEEPEIRRQLGEFNLRRQILQAKQEHVSKQTEDFNGWVKTLNTEATTKREEEVRKTAEGKPLVDSKPVAAAALPLEQAIEKARSGEVDWKDVVTNRKVQVDALKADPSRSDEAKVSERWQRVFESFDGNSEEDRAGLDSAIRTSEMERAAAAKRDEARNNDLREWSKEDAGYLKNMAEGAAYGGGGYSPDSPEQEARAKDWADATFQSDPNKKTHFAKWGELAVNPALIFKPDEYTAAVSEAEAPGHAKEQAMQKLPALQEQAAGPVFEGFLLAEGTEGAFQRSIQQTIKKAGWPAGMRGTLETMARDWKPDQKARAVQEFMQSPEFSPNWNQIALGLSSGLDAIQQQAYGIGSMFGSQDAQLAGEEEMRQQQAQGQARQAGGGSQMLGTVTEGATSIVPSLVVGGGAGLVARGLGMGATAVSTAGLAGARAGASLQSAGSTMIEARKAGFSQIEAVGSALTSGAITGAIMKASGATGVEKLFRYAPGTEKTLAAIKPGFIRHVSDKLKGYGVDGLKEAVLEEVPDQLLQNFLKQATYAPSTEATEGLVDTFIVSFLLGGGVNAATDLAQAGGQKLNAAKLIKDHEMRAELGQRIAMQQTPEVLTATLAGSPLEQTTPEVLEKLAGFDARIADGQEQLGQAKSNAAKLYSNRQLAQAYGQRLEYISGIRQQIQDSYTQSAIEEIDNATPPETAAPAMGMASLTPEAETNFEQDKVRAKALLAVATGKLDTLDTASLQSIDLARDDKGAIVQAKGKTTSPDGVPRVIFQEGEPIITQGTIDRMTALFPATEPLIGQTESQRREQILAQVATAEAAKAAPKEESAATDVPQSETAAPAATPKAKAKAVEKPAGKTYLVEVDGQEDPVSIVADSPEQALDRAAAKYRTMVRGVEEAPEAEVTPVSTLVTSELEAKPEPTIATTDGSRAEAAPQPKPAAAKPKTPPAAPITPAGIVKAIAKARPGKPSPEQSKRYVTAAKALSEETSKWQAAFPGGVRTAENTGSGGVQVTKGSKPSLVLDFGAMAESLDALEESGVSWVKLAIQEEVIHAVAVQLEADGKLDMAGIFDALPAEMQQQVREAYKFSGEPSNLGHEFFRMWVQQRLSGTAPRKGQPVLTEQAIPEGVIAKLTEALNVLLNYFRDLAKSLRKQGADAETIARVTEAGDMIEAGVRALEVKPAAEPEKSELAVAATPEAASEAEPARDYMEEARTSKYPLGVFRNYYPDRKLEKVSDEELASMYKEVGTALGRLEDDWDENPDKYEGESSDRRKLYETGVKYSQIELERLRRRKSDTFIGDVFREFGELASKLGVPDGREGTMVADLRVMFEVIRQSAMTDEDVKAGYDFVKGSSLERSNDYAEVLGYRAERAKQWAKWFSENPVPGEDVMEADVVDTEVKPATKQLPAPAPPEVKPEAPVAETPEPAPEAEAESEAAPGIKDLASLQSFFGSLLAGKVTAQQVKDGWETYKSMEKDILREMSKKTMKELERYQGYRKPDNKAQAVKAAMEVLEGYFNPTDSLSYGGFVGASTDMASSRREAMDRVVALWTDEAIEKQAREIREAQEAKAKALTNPETKDEWEKFVYRKGRTSLTPEEVKQILASRSVSERQQAVMDKGESLLTPEELAAYDSARGVNRKEQQAQRDAAKARVQAVKADTTTEITETKHTKTGEDLFVVKLADRVEKEVYTSLLTAAKRLGGYYSSYRGGGAVPGFQFKSRETAEQFQKVAKGESVDRTEAIEEKKAESVNAAAARMVKMAEVMDTRADTILNADRKTNTVKRAREAGYAESNAAGLKAMAGTMRNLAAAMESGEATHLDGVRAKTHVETLQSLAKQAKDAAERAAGMSYSDTEKTKGDKPTAEQMNSAVYPAPYLSKGDILSLVAKGEKTLGAKLLAQRVAKIRMNTPDGDAVRLSSASDIATVRELLEKLGDKTFDWKFESYDRLQAMGLLDLPSLRAALREFLQYSEGRAKADPLKAMERDLVGRNLPGFFPTPPAVISKMMDEAGDLTGLRVLEPSAGKGDIAEAARAAGAQVDPIEMQSSLRDILQAKGFNVIGDNFEDFAGAGDYDAVLMNPPFEDGQDMAHVQKAFSALKPGGKLVAVMSEGPFGRSDRKSVEFREWLAGLDGTSEKLPEGSFKSAFRSTGVATRLVVVEKPVTALAAQSPARLLKQAGVDAKALKQAADRAGREQDGERTVGDPTRSLGAGTDAQGPGRDAILGASGQYAENMTQESFAQWDADARAMLEADYEGTVKKIMKYGLTGGMLTPELTRAAQIIAEQEARKPMDRKQRIRLQAIVWSYRLAGTEQARGLAARRDPFKTKVERHREFLAKIVFTPPPAVRAAVEAAETPEQKQSILAADQKRIDDIVAALAKMGVTLDDIFNGDVTLRLKSAQVVNNIVGTFDAKKQKAFRLMQGGDKSFDAIAKESGLTGAEVRKARDQFIAELRKRHFDKFRTGMKADQVDVDTLSAQPVSTVSDEEAEAEFQKALRMMGIFPEAQQGKRRNVKRKPKVAPGAPPAAPEETSVLVGADLGNDTDVHLLGRVADAAASKPFDMAIEYYYSNILGGPMTHVKNVTSNFLFGAWNLVMQRGMESALNLVLKNDSSANFGEFKHIMNAIGPAWARGVKIMSLNWITEEDHFMHEVLQEPVGSGDSVLENRRKAAIPGVVGKVVRMGPRALLAMDGFFKGLFATLEVAAHAYRMAKAEVDQGDLKEADLPDRMNSLIYVPGSAAWDAAVKQANTNSFTTPLDKNNNPLDAVAKWVLTASASDSRILRFFAVLATPFVKTPYNIIKEGVRRSPAGSILLLKHMSTIGLAQISREGKVTTRMKNDFVVALAEQIFAWTAMALWGAVEGDDDDLEKFFLITGSAPATRELRAQQEATMGGPYVMRIGKTTIPYGYIEPFATVLGTTADFIRTAKSGAEGTEKVKIFFNSVRRGLVDKTFLTGLKTLSELADIDAMGGGIPLEQRAVKVILQSIVPNIIRQPLRNSEATVPAYGAAPWYYAAVPLMLGDTEPKINPSSGEVVEKTGSPASRILVPFTTKPEDLHPVDKVLLQWNQQNPTEAWAPYYQSPNRTVNKQEIKLNPQTVNLITKRGAILARRSLEGLDLQPNRESVERIKKAYEDGRQIVWDSIKHFQVEQLGELKE